MSNRSSQPHLAAPSFSLDKEQRDRLEQVRELVQGEFKARGQEYLDGSFPWENMRKLAKLGVLGMAVDKKYGGSQLTVFDTALVLEEIAKGCYITAMATLGEVGTQTRVISAFAPERIKKKYLPQVVTCDCVLSICLTEPLAGTDIASYTTNAEVRGDKAVLNGVKSLISRAEEASLFVVFTRVNGVPGTAGIGCAIIEQGTPGLSLTAKVHTLGGENLHEVNFTDCEIPLDQLVVRDQGLKPLMSAFNTQRCLNPSISLGLAEGAFDEAISYARKRQAFGRRIGDFQGMRWKLADMYIAIEAARGLLYRACLSANPFPDPLLAATAKIRCNEMSLDVVSEALQVHGGFGFTDDCVVSRLYRGARYGTLGGGTSETLRDLVGKRIMNDFNEREGISSLIV